MDSSSERNFEFLEVYVTASAKFHGGYRPGEAKSQYSLSSELSRKETGSTSSHHPLPNEEGDAAEKAKVRDEPETNCCFIFRVGNFSNCIPSAIMCY